MSNKNSNHYFLKGGGVMGELIRAKDWSKTALGDPSGWPQSLCTMVAVMLENPFSMYIAWGNEYIQLYNDAYRPILGATKHPQALGISTRETFSEIWHIIGSMFDDVMNGNAVGYPDLMLPLNRNGYVEECYFDFSYSPIRKDDGTVGGVLVTVIETTEKKSVEKALNESNSRYINNILQAPIAMCIFRGKNHVVEIANERMLNLWGKKADQILNKPIFEGLPEAKDQGLEALVDKVYTTGEKFEANERPINLPRNGKIETVYLNFVYDALKEIDGTISGIVATATEVTSQVNARTKIEESEQKVRAIVKNAPFPIAVYVGKEMTIELANPSIINLWGKGNDVIGKSFRDILPELDNQLVFEQIERVFTTGVSFHTKNTPINLLVDGNLNTYYFNYSLNALYDINGNIYGVMNTGVDLTDLNIAKKRIEESDKRFRNTMKQAPIGITILRGPQYIVEMANDAYLQLVDKTEAEFVGNLLFTSLPEVQESVQSLLDNVLTTGVPYHGNEVPIPINRYGKQDIFYFDFLYYPLKEEDGKISGVIATVSEVTEKVEARKKIEERKRIYETITQNTPDLIYVFDLNYRFTYINEALLKMWGRTWDDSIEKGMLEIGYEPWQAEMHEKEIDEVILTKKPIRGEVSFPHATLGNRIYDYIFVPVIDQDGKVEAIAGTTRDITQQVEARKQIEQNELRFRNMVEQAPVAISILRGENYVVDVANEKQLELWGKTKEQILNKPIFIALPEVVGQGFEEMLHGVFTTGKPFIANESPITLIRNGKNETIYIDFVYEPLYDNDHKIDGVLSVVVEVTDHIIARRKIEESEQRFQAAISAVQGILWTNNENGEMEGEQLSWSSLTGQTYEEYQGFGWTKVVHPDDAQPTVDAWNQAVEQRKTFIFEHRLKIKNGQWRDFSIRAIPLVNTDGTLRQWVGVHTDITVNKQAAKALKVNEEKLTIVIEASELGTWEIDLKTNNITGSDRFREIMGYKQKNNLTLNDTIKNIHPDYVQLRNNAFEKAFETGILYFTGQIISEDHSIRWVENKGKVFYDDQNKPLTIIGTTADITDEKQQQQILLESEQKFRLLADSMPQQIWTSDPQGNLNYYNQSVYDYSGLTVEQINKDKWIQIVHPDDREENIRKWTDSISTGNDFLFEHRFRRYDGAYRWQLSRAIPQKDKNGKIQMWVGTSTDIQDQKTFAKELERQVSERTKELGQKNNELEKMNKELESFAYISSHDLQEPLRKIQTFVSRILEKEEYNLSENGKDMFNRMQNSAKRMQILIQDLLAYSRTNTTERKFETTDLNKIIVEVKDDLKEELILKNATIETSELGEVDVIPYQFRQLMLNLIGNSLKYSNRDNPPIIKIKSEIADGIVFNNVKLSPQIKYCHITVSDNGIGFKQQYSERIFEIFQRLHGREEYTGTGIGLAIVKKIIENHNGIITATGELNNGATFDIYIPTTSLTRKIN